MGMRLHPAILSVTFLLTSCGKFVARQNISPEAARQQFAQNYIAAIQSRDPNRLKVLLHPQVLACKNFAEFFEATKETAMEEQPAPGYRVTFSPLTGDSKVPLLPPDKFTYPVQPGYQLRIDWNRSADGSSIASIIQPLAEKDGTWFLVYPCPNDEGMKFTHERFIEGQEQMERARTLVSQLQDPLKTELLVLLKQGQKIEAVKKYQSATGADLSTAVQVINALETTSR
jgi:hypothetical protein